MRKNFLDDKESNVTCSSTPSPLPTTTRTEDFFLYDPWKGWPLDYDDSSVTTSLPQTFQLIDDPNIYFRTVPDGNVSCFIAGTNWSISSTDCRCLDGYHGVKCGIPSVVWSSCLADTCQLNELRIRQKPRRIIHGFNINHEVQFLDIRLGEIGHVVDVFIVAESNVTAGGDAKPLYILPALKKGAARRWQHKMLHVFIDHFPEEGYRDGWLADTFIRDEMGRQGLARIQDIRSDDIFLLLDADEIPSPQVLLFLKLYDGYPEPVALTFRWSVYGFFWRKAKAGTMEEEDTTIVAAATMDMISKVYDTKVMSLRWDRLMESPFVERLVEYRRPGSIATRKWNIGNVGQALFAGFHCSWCYDPEGIRLKLVSAQKNDKPRWGDYPEKLDPQYIGSLVDKGWFDGSKPLNLVDQQNQPYAPEYVIRNADRFERILRHPAHLHGS